SSALQKWYDSVQHRRNSWRKCWHVEGGLRVYQVPASAESRAAVRSQERGRRTEATRSASKAYNKLLRRSTSYQETFRRIPSQPNARQDQSGGFFWREK
ncbi:unnamed protein product, partial [Ascophyllum nodosum]